jgi:hypothetical protein
MSSGRDGDIGCCALGNLNLQRDKRILVLAKTRQSGHIWPSGQELGSHFPLQTPGWPPCRHVSFQRPPLNSLSPKEEVREGENVELVSCLPTRCLCPGEEVPGAYAALSPLAPARPAPPPPTISAPTSMAPLLPATVFSTCKNVGSAPAQDLCKDRSPD